MPSGKRAPSARRNGRRREAMQPMPTRVATQSFSVPDHTGGWSVSAGVLQVLRDGSNDNAQPPETGSQLGRDAFARRARVITRKRIRKCVRAAQARPSRHIAVKSRKQAAICGEYLHVDTAFRVRRVFSFASWGICTQSERQRHYAVAKAYPGVWPARSFSCPHEPYGIHT